MKEEILDAEALLSCATAELSMPSPDLSAALAHIQAARDKLLNLAEGMDAASRN